MHREVLVQAYQKAQRELVNLNQLKIDRCVTKILADCMKAAEKGKPSLKVDVPKFASEGVRRQLLELKYDVEDGEYGERYGGRKSHWLKITWWKE